MCIRVSGVVQILQEIARRALHTGRQVSLKDITDRLKREHLSTDPAIRPLRLLKEVTDQRLLEVRGALHAEQCGLR